MGERGVVVNVFFKGVGFDDAFGYKPCVDVDKVYGHYNDVRNHKLEYLQVLFEVRRKSLACLKIACKNHKQWDTQQSQCPHICHYVHFCVVNGL